MNSNMLNTSNIVSPHDALYTSSQGPYQMTSSQGPYQMTAVNNVSPHDAHYTSTQLPYDVTAQSKGFLDINSSLLSAAHDLGSVQFPYDVTAQSKGFIDIHSTLLSAAHNLGSVQLPYDVAAHSNGMVDDNYCPRFTDAADASHSFLDTDTTILTVGHGPMNTLVDMHYAA